MLRFFFVSASNSRADYASTLVRTSDTYIILLTRVCDTRRKMHEQRAGGGDAVEGGVVLCLPSVSIGINTIPPLCIRRVIYANLPIRFAGGALQLCPM